MKSLLEKFLIFGFLLHSFGLGLANWAQAIVINPTTDQVTKALEKGVEAKKNKIPPNQLYWHFGSSENTHPHGFLMTKLTGLAVFSSHFSHRSKKPSKDEIVQMLSAKDLMVNVTVFGLTPDFAVDSYVVLKQSDRLIKPRNVRSDARASRSTMWPKSPSFQAKIVASFAYGDFDPQAKTTLVVFPGSGGEIVFDLDFSQIP